MDIKENINFILQQRGMTQTDIAEKLDVTRQTISYYLHGNITLQNLQRIADALDTTVEAIVSEVPLSAKGETIPKSGKTTVARLVCPHCGQEITIIAR